MTSPHWLDDREARAWRAFARMQVRLDARLARDLLRDAGLSMADYAVLVQLSEAAGERLRVLQLGQAMEWEKSRLSHHLSRMERRGLVAREECETDARGAFICLTPQGRQAIEQAAPRHVEHVRRCFIDLLTPHQLDCLSEIAETVLERLCAGEDDEGRSE